MAGIVLAKLKEFFWERVKLGMCSFRDEWNPGERQRH